MSAFTASFGPAAWWAARDARRAGRIVDADTRRRELAHRHARRQALKAASVSALPIPGVDIVVGGRLLAGALGSINLLYGLAPEQLAELPAPVRSRLDTLARDLGSYVIGRVVTEATVFAAARALGLELGAQQAAKLAPVAGQVASALLSGWLFMRLCDRHIEACERVRAALPELPRLPPPAWDDA